MMHERGAPTDTPRSVAAVGWFLLNHPVWLLRQWNWKSAILSSASRGSLFFTTNLSMGLDAAAAASAVFTVLSTQFNLYAMRSDVLIVGMGSRPLLDDLRRVPALLLGFARSVLSG